MEAAGLHGAGRVVEDLHVGTEHVEAGLPRLDVVPARDDHHVFGFELVVAPPADLRAREQRQRVQVVERLAPGPDPGAVVERDPPGEPLHDERPGGGDADAARTDDPDVEPSHWAVSLRTLLAAVTHRDPHDPCSAAATLGAASTMRVGTRGFSG